MYNLYKPSSLLEHNKQIGGLPMLLLVLLAICAFSQLAKAQTSTYVFLPDQSTVVQTGGIAGVHETYGIEGKFQLTVDFDAGIASFDKVDANLTEPSGFLYTQSLGVLFNMTELAGTVFSDTAIQFKGKTSDDTNTDILINLTFMNNSVHLTGETIPPPGSADMFVYKLDALASKKYAGGTGEQNDPYQIATAEDLMLLGETPEDYDKHFILTGDIDLAGLVFDKAVIAPGTIINDIGMPNGTYFTGSFDGNQYKITNLTIEGQMALGLFGALGPGALVANLGLEAVDVNGTVGVIGGLVGYNDGNVSNCYSTGKVTGSEPGGGTVGGLVGLNWLGRISSSYSTVFVIGNGDVGGLVGSNGSWNSDGGLVTQCCSTGAVTGNNSVGGLVGFNRGSISSSYNTGTVSGSVSWYNGVGGLVGSNFSSGTITASYSSGMVTCDMFIGGLVGYNSKGVITKSYSTGTVSGTYDVGGLVGWDALIPGTATGCFWDVETSEQTSSAGGTGKTTAEMQTASTFLEAGWDFVDEIENGTEDIWDICEGTNYPRFVWQIPVGDFVCPDGISIEDFLFFAEHWRDDNCDSSNDYCQGTDLDHSGTVDVSDLEIFFDIWLAGISH